MTNGNDNRQPWWRQFIDFAAVVALLTGLLYLAGIATLWVRLRNAGLPGQDFMPLFSLDQLLRIGLTWISPAVPGLLGLAVLYVASVYFEQRLDRRAAEFEGERVPTLDDSARNEWVESFRQLRTRTDWSAINKEVGTAIAAGHAEPVLKRWRRFSRRLTAFGAWTGFIGVVLAGAMVFLPPVVAAITFVVWVVTGLLVGTRPAAHGLAPLFGVVALAFVANAIVNPRPLPLATVITDAAPNGLSGDFVVSSDGSWYLGQGDSTVLAVRADEVKCSRLVSRPRVDSLWRVVADEELEEPTPGELTCE